MSSSSTGRPAGSPSTITTSPRPCDSPAVRNRSTPRPYLSPTNRPAIGWPIERPPRSDGSDGEEDGDGAEGEAGAEGVGLVGAADGEEDEAEEGANDPGHEHGLH